MIIELIRVGLMMTDWYAKDCSKKVKSAYKAKGMTGKPLCPPPYGYMKSPDKKDFWIVDEEAAAVVRQVFQLSKDYSKSAVTSRKTKSLFLPITMP